MALTINPLEQFVAMIHWQENMWLWGVLIFPISFLIGWLLLILKQKKIQLLGNERNRKFTFQGFRPQRVFWRSALYGSIAALFCLGLARPQWGKKTLETKRKGMYLVVALDLSRSMLAEDIQPNRLFRARQAIIEWLNLLKNDQLALVVFAATAHVHLPMTSDYGAARLFLESMDVDVPAVQGTSLAAAIETSIKAIPESRDADAAIILISDGEDHEGEALTLAQNAADKGIELHTIAIGSNAQVPVPNQNGTFLRDAQGNVVLSKTNRTMLANLAAAGNGTFADDPHPGDALKRVFSELENRERSDLHSPILEEGRQEYAPWFLAPAFLLLILDMFWKPSRKNYRNAWDWFGK